jgi:hypothetical protein
MEVKMYKNLKYFSCLLFLLGQAEVSSMDKLPSDASEQKDEKLSQRAVPKHKDDFITEVATSYGLSTDELKEEAINFIDQRTTMMHEKRQHAGLDNPTSIDDLIVVKKADPNTFVDKFNAFLRANGKEGAAKATDFDFNYPMFLVPLDTN